MLVTFISSISIETYMQIDTTTALAESFVEPTMRLEKLRTLGNKLAQAVLSRDIEVILHHDRPDLVNDDLSV